MATECRRPRRFNRNKRMKAYAYLILILLVVMGFIFGRVSAPTKVETKTETITETITIIETVEVPVHEEDTLPEVTEVFLYDIPLSESLQRYIYEVSEDEHVPVTLIFAMIEHESGFNHEVISVTDDYGLMQINEVNHKWLAEEYRCADFLNPYQNVFCGIKIISSYFEKYEGDYHKALMAYNMGEYGAVKAWQNGVTSTNYSTRIISLMKQYEEVRG